MHTFLRFPGFKDKAMTLSYDDGVIYDKRLVEIMQKYGLKGTFNLNGGVMVDNGRRMDENALVETFRDSGMEVAMHGFRHLMVTACPKTDLIGEFYQDKLRLESVFGTVMRGGAYAYGAYNDETVDILRSLGVEYFRTTKSTGSFALPTDWLRLNPTTHHNGNLPELFRAFVEPRPDNRPYLMGPRLFYLWGHSYEFDKNNNWDHIENICKRLSGDEQVWFATNIEICDYVEAYKRLKFSANGHRVYNPTLYTIWIDVDSKLYSIPSGETIVIE